MPLLLDRIRACFGEPLLRQIGARAIGAYESGTGVYFDIRPAPCGAQHIVILWNEETDLFRVQLCRGKDFRLIQGKSGVPLSELGAVVLRLSRHG